MNHRLPSAALTNEDYDIWTYGARAKLTYEFSQLQNWRERICETNDRRDAELMLGAQLKPTCVAYWRDGLDHLILLRGPPPRQRLTWPE